MTLRAIAIIGGCAAAQLSLGACLSGPWWLPDLILIAIVVAATESPRSASVETCLLGGVVALAAAIHAPRWIGLAYSIVGWLAVGLSDRIELRPSARLQVAVGVGEAALLILGRGVAWWSLVRWLSTVACAPVVRRLTASRRAPPSSA